MKKKCGESHPQPPPPNLSQSPTLPSIPHPIFPFLSVCPWFIYQPVGGIDSRLYGGPLKPRGDSPCQAAGSNEKLKEHINSSIWGHEDENSCQGPARNNRSRNAAPIVCQRGRGSQAASWRHDGRTQESWPGLGWASWTLQWEKKKYGHVRHLENKLFMCHAEIRVTLSLSV